MKLALTTLVITAAVNIIVLFGLETRGTYMSGAMLLVLAIYFGGASLITALVLCVARYISPTRFGRGIVFQAFAVTFVFLQLALVREVGVRLVKNDVQEAKTYCGLVIDQLKRNSEGKYPRTLEDLKLPPSMPRLLNRRPFYTASDDQREYELHFSWDFDYAWFYSSKDGRWRFSS
jgi:hypothetical protein